MGIFPNFRGESSPIWNHHLESWRCKDSETKAILAGPEILQPATLKTERLKAVFTNVYGVLYYMKLCAGPSRATKHLDVEVLDDQNDKLSFETMTLYRVKSKKARKQEMKDWPVLNIQPVAHLLVLLQIGHLLLMNAHH